MIHKVDISRLLIDDASSVQTLVLQECVGDGRRICICIGRGEALAISAILNEEPFPRPLTHTLAACLIDSLGGRLEKVVIADMKNVYLGEGASQITFFAELHIRQGERLIIIDSRPSDAISLALTARAPLFVDEKVFTLSAI